MKNYKQVEIILFSKYTIGNVRQKELVRWLGTIAQSAIVLQHERARKIFLKTLKGTPAIYMS
jgi:hypothetical protein